MVTVGMTVRALLGLVPLLYFTATFDSVSLTASLFALELGIFIARLSARDTQQTQPKRMDDTYVDATLPSASRWLHLFRLPVTMPTRVGLALVILQHLARIAIAYKLLGFKEQFVPSITACIILVGGLALVTKALYRPKALFDQAKNVEGFAVLVYLVFGCVLLGHHYYRPQTFKFHSNDWRLMYAGIVQVCQAALVRYGPSFVDNTPEDIKDIINPEDTLDVVNGLLWWWLWASAGHKRLTMVG